MDPMQASGQNQMGQAPQMQPKRSIGPIIAIVAVIALLIIGALYFWGEKLSSTAPAVENQPVTSATANTQPTSQSDAAQQPAVSSADDINTLNAELEASGSGNVDFSELE